MNIFRLVGDLSHLLAIIILLRKIWKTRSCAVYKRGYGTYNLTRAKPRQVEIVDEDKKDLVCKVHTVPSEKIRSETPISTGVKLEIILNVSLEDVEEWLDQLRFLEGISGKSQILFAVVYTTRYLDLVTTYVSLYNTFMKLVFIAASYATCYLIYFKFKATYDHNHDTFRIEFLLAPAVILALLINHDFTFLEILWTFSIYLESVAILPQLFMVSKTGEAESITSHYLFALGSYRGLYILNWIYRYIMENTYDLIAIVAGIVQTVLYCDFFYLYITKVLRGKKLQLPA